MKLLQSTTRSKFTSPLLLVVVLCLAGAGYSSPQRARQLSSALVAGPAEGPPMLAAMGEELARSMAILSKADPPAYFIGYTVTEVQRAEVMGSNGALLNSQESRSRWLEVQVRTGSYDLDDTHKVGDRQPSFSAGPGASVPIEDDAAVVRRVIWLETDRQYRTAAEALIKIKTGKEVKVETSEGRAPDFSREAPHTFYSPRVSVTLDRRPWEGRVRAYTQAFRSSPAVLNSIVTLSAVAQNQYQVSSEGTRLQFGQLRYRLELFIQGKAPDGMDINRYYNYDWTDPNDAPDDKTVLAQTKILTQELEALVAAPLVEPYAGPAMLTGRAAAVFFHEVFGHRAEGHRQKDISEGQTFARKVGERILPDFLSIYDDPTQGKLGSTVLLGYYPFDDEGVQAQHVSLVERGVLRDFLMSRSPLVGFPKSNGHGRRQLGFTPVSRQGNLIVESSRKVTNAQLRQKLIEEIKRQGKPFGLLIDDIAGGFTFTGRGQPQAFQVLPLVVYKVYPDGRPDELVRGVDIVGTPLVSLTKIVATGDTPEAFNGYCGAESGSVPVAAVSPAILISELEIQKKETSTDKPPILPPPAHDPKGPRP
ncbi:MAG TPA: metallopeptidase TldD-related protein [Candidatus Acidoferrales bacterium]|nr:metallopeptidase TldD-related protein [Candidatus Acidoferrales bacterium]